MTSDSNNHCRPAGALSLFCRHCASPLVQASGWTKEDEAHWNVRLWCPECWQEQAVVLDRTQAAYLSLAIEEGFACVLEAFEGLDSIVTREPGAERYRGPGA